MALFAVSRAVSSSVKRSIVVAEKKHVDRLQELDFQLKINAETRVNRFAKRLYDQSMDHAQFVATLHGAQLDHYNQCVDVFKASSTEPADKQVKA